MLILSHVLSYFCPSLLFLKWYNSHSLSQLLSASFFLSWLCSLFMRSSGAQRAPKRRSIKYVQHEAICLHYYLATLISFCFQFFYSNNNNKNGIKNTNNHNNFIWWVCVCVPFSNYSLNLAVVFLVCVCTVPISTEKIMKWICYFICFD